MSSGVMSKRGTGHPVGELKAWCKEKGVLQEFPPPYHHASIGFVEHFNQTLLNRVRRMWVDSPKLFAEKVRKSSGHLQSHSALKRSGFADQFVVCTKGNLGIFSEGPEGGTLESQLAL